MAIFFYVGMLTRGQLAVRDFNDGICLEYATTGLRDKHLNVTFPKVIK